MQDIQMALTEILTEVRTLAKKVDRQLPTFLTQDEAAKELAVSLTTLKAYVRAGLIISGTFGDGGHPKVPSCEVIRLRDSMLARRLTEVKGVLRRERAPLLAAKTAREMAASVREQLRKRG